MPQVSAYATSAVGTVGTWGTPANATGADNAVYATWTNATRRGAATLRGAGFGSFSTIPEGSTINFVRVRVKGHITSAANVATVTGQLMLNGTGYGTATTWTPSGVVGSVYPTFDVTGVSLVDVQSGNLQVDNAYTRQNNTTSSTVNVDSFQLTVDYSDPVPPPAIPNFAAARQANGDLILTWGTPDPLVTSIAFYANPDSDAGDTGAFQGTSYSPASNTFTVPSTDPQISQSYWRARSMGVIAGNSTAWTLATAPPAAAASFAAFGIPL